MEQRIACSVLIREIYLTWAQDTRSFLWDLSAKGMELDLTQGTTNQAETVEKLVATVEETSGHVCEDAQRAHQTSARRGKLQRRWKRIKRKWIRGKCRSQQGIIRSGTDSQEAYRSI